MCEILHRGGIKTTPHKAFGVLTQEKGLAGWWSKSVTASPVVGAVNKFRFGDRGFNDMKVMELVPGKRVRWQCVDGAPEWIGTELTFDFKHEADSTVVLFRQRGWKEQGESCTIAAPSGLCTCSASNPFVKQAKVLHTRMIWT